MWRCIRKLCNFELVQSINWPSTRGLVSKMAGFIQRVHHLLCLYDHTRRCYHGVLFSKGKKWAFILNWDPIQFFFFHLPIYNLIGGAELVFSKKKVWLKKSKLLTFKWGIPYLVIWLEKHLLIKKLMLLHKNSD